MAAGARNPAPGSRLFRPRGDVSTRRWAFISDHRAAFGVERICRVFGTNRAGYCRHVATEQARAERQAEKKQTVSEIRAIHTEHHGAYGAPRGHAELRARGRSINHIVGRHLRKKNGRRPRTGPRRSRRTW
ncbi:transposase [Streptomyces sp. A1547]|nr:transposase [Streptomyces sp. A1547]